MKNTIFLILILTGWQTGAAQKTVPCDIQASINNSYYSTWTTDRSGTNVRKGAGTNFPIVKTLKDKTGFIFHITASRGNWVQIDRFFQYEAEGEQKLDGWIYAPSMFLIVQDKGDEPEKFVSNLYAAPDWKSRLLFPKHKKIEDAVVVQGCHGKWVKVSYRGTVGWLNPNSHCPLMWDDGDCQSP